MFANIGFTELAVILAICIVLFGAKRIPEIGSSIGKGIREFKRGVSDLQESTRTPVLAEQPEPVTVVEPPRRRLS